MSKDLNSNPLCAEDDLVPKISITISPGMVFQQADGTICACNPSALSILGYRIEELQGRSYTDIAWRTIHADGSPFGSENHPAMVALKTSNKSGNVVMGFYKPDGELIWLSLSSEPLFGSDATTPYGVVTTFTQLDAREVPGAELRGCGGVRDFIEKQVEESQEQAELEHTQQKLLFEITQRQEIESRLVAANNQLEQQVEARTAELSQALAALGESAALYQTLAKNFPNGAVVLFDFNLRYLLIEGEGLVSISVSSHEIIGKTIWEVLPKATCATLEPIFRKALAGETTLTEIPYKNYIYSVYVLPIKNQQGEIFAGMVMTQDITERKLAEAELQKSHQSLITTLESITDAFFTLDTEWRFTYINHQATQLLQRERDDLIGKCIWDEFPEAVGSTFYQNYHRAVLEQVLIQFEEIYLPLDAYYHVRAYPTREGLAVYFQDITTQQAVLQERKESEIALRESQQRLQAIFNHSFQFFGLLKPDGTVLEINQTALNFVGVSSQEVVGRLFWETPWWNHSQETIVQLQAAIHEAATGNIVTFEATHINLEGNTVIVDVSISPVRNETGQVILLVPEGRNITESRKTELALKASEAKLRSFFEANVIGTLFGDIYGNIHDANDEFLRIIGYTREDLRAGRVRWIDITPSEDLYLDERAVIEAQKRGACTPFEKRYIRKDGSHILVLIGYSLHGENRDESVAFILDLTERKRIEANLRESEERIRVATTAAELGMWFWDITIDKLVWTPKCKTLFGITADTEMSYDLFISRLHPDDRSRTHIAVMQALANKDNYDIEYRTVWNDGSIHWIAAKGRAFYDNMGQPVRMMGTTQDISLSKFAEEALRQSELNFRTLADTMPQIIWTARPDGWIDYYNQRWYDYTGMNQEQTQGWGWKPVLHPDDLQMCIDTWSESVRTGKPYQIEYRFLRASDGQYRWHLGRAFGMRDESGQIVKWFGSNTDIDDNKQIEVTLQDALQQQQIAREEAEKANRIKDEFLAVLSHELRSPLNPILGWSKLLKAGKLNPKQTQQALETIERNAKLQIDLIDDLLDVSRILRGKLTLNISWVNLNSIITAACETVSFAAQAKKIELVTILEPNIEKAQGDPPRLQQVVLNLLTNAVKFTPNNGRIEVKLVGGSDAKIAVTDTGKGISPEFLPSIFDYFRQEDSSITRKFGGLGLGLAIVRQIVELHGGTVKAESPGLEQGSTFTVMLPLMSQPEIMCDRTQELPSEPLNLSGIRVLVVDDENDSRDFVSFTLQHYGASVTTASSASEALQMMALLKPDVLVSDIGMPEMNGYALIRKIRSWTEEQGGLVSAIAVTAYAGEYDQRQAIEAGFQMHVSKPVEPEILATAVRRWGNKG